MKRATRAWKCPDRRAARPCQRHRREESAMYIGLGTVVVIVIIVLAIMFLRRA